MHQVKTTDSVFVRTQYNCNMKKVLIFSFVFLFIGIATPAVFAQEEGSGIAQLSGCTGLDCSACNVVDMANGLITWLIGILFVVFALLLAIAGVKLVTSGGNHHALDEAKSSFMNAIIGFIIILAAWLIVDTIMRGLVGRPGQEGMIGGEASGWLFWSEIECQSQTVTNTEDVTQEEVEIIPLDPASFEGGGIEVVRYTPGTGSGAGGSAGGSGGGGADSGTSGSGGGLTMSLRGGGTVSVLPCQGGASSRVNVNLFGGTAHVHRNLAASVRRIDTRWRALGGNGFYRVTSVGGYVCRNIAGSSRLSIHSYGLAIDINPNQNPHCPSWAACNGRNVLITNMPATFVNLFRNEGWGWGGNWNSSKDAMHFSKYGGEQGDMRGE
jgi:hypothetical protein